VILGLSGGVDSERGGRPAAQGHRRPTDLHLCEQRPSCAGGKAQVVQEVFGRHFRIKLQYENASRLFLSRLKGVTEPERKRQIIGRTFIEVFEAATKRAGTGQVPGAGDALS